MALDDLRGDGQAQARAAGFPRTRLVDPVEALEDAAAVGLRDADAVVRDLHPDPLAHGAGGDADVAAVGRVLDGVAEHVHHDLLSRRGRP